MSECTVKNPRELMIAAPDNSGVEILLSIMTDRRICREVKLLLERFQTKDETIIFSKGIVEGTVEFKLNDMPLTYEKFLDDIATSLSTACKSSSIQNTKKIEYYFKECLNKISVLYNLVSLNSIINSELFTTTLERVYLTVKNTMPEDMAKKNSVIFLKELSKALKVELQNSKLVNNYYAKLNKSIKDIITVNDVLIPKSNSKGITEPENSLKYNILDELAIEVIFKLPFNEHTKEWYKFNTDLVIKYLGVVNRYETDALENKTIAEAIKRAKVPVLAILPLGTNMSLVSVNEIYEEVLKLNTANTLVIYTLTNNLDSDMDIKHIMNLYMDGYNKECTYLYPNNKEYLSEFNPENCIKRVYGLLSNAYDYNKGVVINENKLEILFNNDLQQINKALKLNIGKKPSEYDYKILLDRLKYGNPYSSGENSNMYYNCNEIVFDFPTLMYSMLNKHKEDIIDCIETDDKEYINAVFSVNKLMIAFSNEIINEYHNTNKYTFEGLLDIILDIINNRKKFYDIMYKSLVNTLTAV